MSKLVLSIADEIIAWLVTAALLQRGGHSELVVTPLGKIVSESAHSWAAVSKLWKCVERKEPLPLNSAIKDCSRSSSLLQVTRDSQRLNAARDGIKSEWLDLVGVPRRDKDGADEWTPEVAARLVIARYFAGGTGTAKGDDAKEWEEAEAEVVKGLLTRV